eukprot:294876-Prorocentrum_minimum.AAC.1
MFYFWLYRLLYLNVKFCSPPHTQTAQVDELKAALEAAQEREKGLSQLSKLQVEELNAALEAAQAREKESAQHNEELGALNENLTAHIASLEGAPAVTVKHSTELGADNSTRAHQTNLGQHGGKYGKYDAHNDENTVIPAYKR